MIHRPIFVLILNAILFAGCKTQQIAYPIEQVELYPISKNDLWGYSDEDGKLKIPYQFEKVTFFSGGRASVKIKGKYGFINSKGKYLIKPKYDSIGYFDHYEAIAFKNGKECV